MDHTAILSTLDGVTTVLVAFLFVCLIFPSIVKNRPQYYAALAMIVFILLVHTMTLMLNKSDAIVVAGGVFTGLLQICALLLLVLCVGGLTARQLAGDMARAYEVMRRGDTKKEVIIPIGKQAARQSASDSPPSPVYHADAGQAGQAKDKDETIPFP
jgi:hypothetical protein